jgi:hypothetical protein
MSMKKRMFIAGSASAFFRIAEGFEIEKLNGRLPEMSVRSAAH